MIILCRKCDAMKLNAIETTQNNRRNGAKFMLTTAAGAAVGAVSRYVLPTKTQLPSVFNRETLDTFVSSASVRGANRSILKYAGIGALVAACANLVAKTFQNGKENSEAIDFTKYEALYDTPADSAYAVMWYGD